LSRARRILLGAAPVVGHRGARVRVPDEARYNERVESRAQRLGHEVAPPVARRPVDPAANDRALERVARRDSG
jgi:hypothetical protein